jgi:hypothetical protein
MDNNKQQARITSASTCKKKKTFGETTAKLIHALPAIEKGDSQILRAHEGAQPQQYSGASLAKQVIKLHPLTS